MTFLVETEHFSGKNGALRWSILVGKQKHNVQKPSGATVEPPKLNLLRSKTVQLREIRIEKYRKMERRSLGLTFSNKVTIY